MKTELKQSAPASLPGPRLWRPYMATPALIVTAQHTAVPGGQGGATSLRSSGGGAGQTWLVR